MIDDVNKTKRRAETYKETVSIRFDTDPLPDYERPHLRFGLRSSPERTSRRDSSSLRSSSSRSSDDEATWNPGASRTSDLRSSSGRTERRTNVANMRHETLPRNNIAPASPKRCFHGNNNNSTPVAIILIISWFKIVSVRFQLLRAHRIGCSLIDVPLPEIELYIKFSYLCFETGAQSSAAQRAKTGCADWQALPSDSTVWSRVYGDL